MSPENDKPSFVAPLPLDEAGRNATEAILPSQDEPEDPVLHSLCELVNRLLDVPMTGVCVLLASHGHSAGAAPLVGDSASVGPGTALSVQGLPT